MNTGKTYSTRQRDALMGFFEEHPDTCYTAAEILREADLQMGEATVYRRLNRFTEEGLLQRYTGEGGAQYRLAHRACDSHFHLKCLQCGRLIHMDCDHMTELIAHIAEEHHFAVDRAHTTLYGLCEACQNKIQSV